MFIDSDDKYTQFIKFSCTKIFSALGLEIKYLMFDPNAIITLITRSYFILVLQLIKVIVSLP